MFHTISLQVSELIELSGGEMDENLAKKFESITRTILSNQTEALTNLTSKVLFYIACDAGDRYPP